MSTGKIAAKVHKSAICLIPPRSTWPAIQEIRVFNDKSFTRWMPHVNLLYPFYTDDDNGTSFQKAAERCSTALASIQPFPVSLHTFGAFEHSKNSTLWLDPASPSLTQLQTALQTVFPDYDDLSNDPARGITEFAPHLSVGQWAGSKTEVEAAKLSLQQSWVPIEFEAQGVALISRKGFDDPFTIRYYVPFGGAPVQQLDTPYIATVGPASGSGTASNGDIYSNGGVYYFAYGANMSPSKLTTRGITPLESFPAQLPGYRLSFTHRGGMGNVKHVVGKQSTGMGGMDVVYGVVHKLTASDYGKLANMEHEYRPVELHVTPSPTSPNSNSNSEKGGGVSAVAFVTPTQNRIQDNLPPPTRYLKLLIEGCRHWKLNSDYLAWLEGMLDSSVEGKDRGKEYYTAFNDGRELPAMPKIRTGGGGGNNNRNRGRGGGGRGNKFGKGNRSGRGSGGDR